jgi:hypothetical protein
MKIDIYRSQKNATKYLSVPAGADPGKLKLSADFDPDLKQLAPFKKGLDINPGDETIGMNPAEIIEQIKKHGYAAHRAGIKMTEKT